MMTSIFVLGAMFLQGASATYDRARYFLKDFIEEGLSYSHNDTIVYYDVNSVNTFVEPSTLFDNSFGFSILSDGIFPDLTLNSVDFVPEMSDSNMRNVPLARGPLIGYNRTISVCGGEYVNGEFVRLSASWMDLPRYTYDIHSKYLWLSNNLRIPVQDMWQSIEDDIHKEYTYTIVQSAPTFVLFHNGESLLVSPLKSNYDSIAPQVINSAKELLGISAQLKPSVSVFPSYVEFLGVPAGAKESLSCIPGSVRVKITEWSFPTGAYGLHSRLSLVDDSGYKNALHEAQEREVLVPIFKHPSWEYVSMRTVRPSLTAGAAQEKYFRLWVDRLNDFSSTLRISIFKFMHWEFDTHYVEMPKMPNETFASIMAVHEAKNPPIFDLRLNWQPYFVESEFRSRGVELGRSAAIASFILGPYPASNALAEILGESWGIAVFMTISVVAVLSSAFYQLIVERRKYDKLRPARRFGAHVRRTKSTSVSESSGSKEESLTKQEHLIKSSGPGSSPKSSTTRNRRVN